MWLNMALCNICKMSDPALHYRKFPYGSAVLAFRGSAAQVTMNIWTIDWKTAHCTAHLQHQAAPVVSCAWPVQVDWPPVAEVLGMKVDPKASSLGIKNVFKFWFLKSTKCQEVMKEFVDKVVWAMGIARGQGSAEHHLPLRTSNHSLHLARNDVATLQQSYKLL